MSAEPFRTAMPLRGDWRRILAFLVLAAILLGGFQFFYLRMFVVDRAAFGRALAEAQYRQAPGLRPFLLEVGQRTRPGDAVALFVPAQKWLEGYDYAYSRSLYHLVGRRVLPLVHPLTDEFLWQNLLAADYVAAWHAEPAFPGFEVVWRGEHGVLMRRVR